MCVIQPVLCHRMSYSKNVSKTCVSVDSSSKMNYFLDSYLSNEFLLIFIIHSLLSVRPELSQTKCFVSFSNITIYMNPIDIRTDCQINCPLLESSKLSS